MRELTGPLLQDWSGTVTRRQVRQVLLILKKKINIVWLWGRFNSRPGKLKSDHYLFSICKTHKSVDGLSKMWIFMLARLWQTPDRIAQYNVAFVFLVYASFFYVRPKWLLFLSLHHSFSTAYQCIYYSPEHTAKAQEVLSTMSLLQPLIASLADQLLQAAQEHSSPGVRDTLKSLCDKVRKRREEASTPTPQGGVFIPPHYADDTETNIDFGFNSPSMFRSRHLLQKQMYRRVPAFFVSCRARSFYTFHAAARPRDSAAR